MAIEKLRPEVIEQMANEKFQAINDDAKYLESIILAATRILTGACTRIRKGVSGYYGDGNIGFTYATLLDSIKTSHGEDRLYVLRDLSLREITNYGTAECAMHHISMNDAMKIYDVDRATFAIKDALKVTKRPRNRIMPDGSREDEMTTNKIPDDTEYSTAYQCYLHAFIGQFADSAKGQPWQEKLLLEAATALGVRDGNASKMSGSPNSLPLNERAFRMALDVMIGHAAAWTNNQIPCTEANLKSQVFRIDHKIPVEIREDAPNIIARGGTIYDLWLFEAEAIIATDLLRMAKPIYLDQIKNPAQLTRLKAIKTCELLFRANALEPDDLNEKKAAYFASLYLAELSSMPLRL